MTLTEFHVINTEKIAMNNHIAEHDELILEVKNPKKFYKANHVVRGSGIGLALADEIITLHNGTLEVESQENLGTAVTIRIPAMQQFDNKDMQEAQQELPIELQEQHITDTETMDTSDMDQNQSNREVEERNNNSIWQENKQK